MVLTGCSGKRVVSLACLGAGGTVASWSQAHARRILHHEPWDLATWEMA